MLPNNKIIMITITNEDNMELMARYPDKHFDLAIVDPPYGIGESSKNRNGITKIKPFSIVTGVCVLFWKSVGHHSIRFTLISAVSLSFLFISSALCTYHRVME